MLFYTMKINILLTVWKFPHSVKLVRVPERDLDTVWNNLQFRHLAEYDMWVLQGKLKGPGLDRGKQLRKETLNTEKEQWKH